MQGWFGVPVLVLYYDDRSNRTTTCTSVLCLRYSDELVFRSCATTCMNTEYT
jgi:hypothetical protein